MEGNVASPPRKRSRAEVSLSSSDDKGDLVFTRSETSMLKRIVRASRRETNDSLKWVQELHALKGNVVTKSYSPG